MKFMSFLSYDLWTTSLVHSSFWPRHTSCKHWIWMQTFRNKLRHLMAWRTEFWLDLKFFVILKIGFNKKASQFDNNIVDSLFVIICHPFSSLSCLLVTIYLSNSLLLWNQNCPFLFFLWLEIWPFNSDFSTDVCLFSITFA